MKPRELEDGLIMRNGTEEDIPALLEHFRVVHGKFVVDELKALLEHRDGFFWEDSFIIENPDSGEIVSCVLLKQNAWSIDGIKLPSAEMEAVGTIEAYRKRGFMHLLNEEFEKRSTELDPAIQAIVGIPYFYRIFGYEYAADLGGGYPVDQALVPRVPDDEEEPVSIEEVDAKTFKEFLSYREKKLPQGTWLRFIRPKDVGYLKFDTTDVQQEAFFFYLVKEKGKTVGVFYLERWESRVYLDELYLDNHKHVDAVLRFTLAKAQEWKNIPVRISPPNQARIKEFVRARTLVKDVDKYAWYVKIPSILRFIETIGPLLTERLKGSEFHDFTGDLTFTTYRKGYALSFEKGKFKGIVEKIEKKLDDYHLRIPKGALTKLFMGYETFDELVSHEPDIQSSATMRPLLRVLFPKLRASVNPFY
jgi:hypothetical protein